MNEFLYSAEIPLQEGSLHLSVQLSLSSERDVDKTHREISKKIFPTDSPVNQSDFQFASFEMVLSKVHYYLIPLHDF